MNLKQLKSPVIHKKIPFLSGYALKNGVHVGHKFLRLSKTNFWHPLMAQYFLGIRHGISLLDPVQTRKCLLRAFYVIALVLKTKNAFLPNITLSGKSKNRIQGNLGTLSKGKKKLPCYLVTSKRPSYQVTSKNLSNHNVEFKNTQKEIQRKGNILIVNTNPEFSQLCKNLSVLTLHNKNKNYLPNINSSSLSYVHYKWVGGTLTNWKQVSKSVLTYAKFAERCEKFLYRNNIEFPRYKKIKECFHGLIRKKGGQVYLAFNEKPDLVFLMNPNENRHIIAEANKMWIPVVALVESNTCLKGISYPIPANAYSAFFIYYCLKKILKISTI